MASRWVPVPSGRLGRTPPHGLHGTPHPPTCLLSTLCQDGDTGRYLLEHLPALLIATGEAPVDLTPSTVHLAPSVPCSTGRKSTIPFIGMILKTVINREGFRAALARSLLTGVDLDDALVSSTVAFVNDRLGRVRGVARIAVLGVESLLAAAFAASGGRSRALLHSLDVTALPVFTDYVRLVRSLALVFVYETRSPVPEE